MTLKLSTIIVTSAIAAGTVIAICVGIQRNNLLPQNQSLVSHVKMETVHCRYMYDEMAHKLVAYNATERCAADQRIFSFKLGSRILEWTKGAQTEPRIITL